jgi:vacuolar protein sorting-associated protein VTA1
VPTNAPGFPPAQTASEGALNLPSTPATIGSVPNLPDTPTAFQSFPPPPAGPSTAPDPASFYDPPASTPTPPPAAPTFVPSPAAHAPITPAPYFPPQPSHGVDDSSVQLAQKHARWAVSALTFDDVDTAVRELRKSLEYLGAA